MKILTSSLRARRGGPSCLLMVAGSLVAVAPALAQPSFQALPMLPNMLEMRPIGHIGGTGNDGAIAYKAISEKGVQIVETGGVYKDGLFFEIPDLFGPNGEYLDVVNVQFRGMQPVDRARPGQTIPGIDVVIRKTPADKAAMWDTRGSDTGVMMDLNDPFGSQASWPNSLNADGSIIVGGIVADLDGMGLARHAARWLNFGSAELMPVPGDSRFSEVWGTSGDGQTSVGSFKVINEQGSESDPKPKPTNGTKGILWNPSYPNGYIVVDPGTLPEATGLAITGITDDARIATAAIINTRSNQKGALYDVQTGEIVVLDGGDINGDGVINFQDDHDSSVYALSLDGRLIGGSIALVPGEETASVWLRMPDNSYTQQSLALFLTNFGITGAEDWNLGAVTGISDDGLTLTGWGTDPLGRTAGWVVTVPTPGTLLLTGLAGIAVIRRRR